MRHELIVSDVLLHKLLVALEKLESQSVELRDKERPIAKDSKQHKFSEYSGSYFPTNVQKLVTDHLEDLFRTVEYDKFQSKRIYTKQQQQELILTAESHFDIINQKNWFSSSIYNLAQLMKESLGNLCDIYEFTVPVEIEKKESSAAHEPLPDVMVADVPAPPPFLTPNVFPSSSGQYFFEVSAERLLIAAPTKNPAEPFTFTVSSLDGKPTTEKTLLAYELDEFNVGIQALQKIQRVVLLEMPQALIDLIMSYMYIEMPFNFLGNMVSCFLGGLIGIELFDSLRVGDICSKGNQVFYFRKSKVHIYSWTEESLSKATWKTYSIFFGISELKCTQTTSPASERRCNSKSDTDKFNTFNQIRFLANALKKAEPNMPISINRLPENIPYRPFADSKGIYLRVSLV